MSSPMDATQSAPRNDVPSNVLSEIFSHTPTDRNSICRVCRYWNGAAISTPSLWTTRSFNLQWPVEKIRQRWDWLSSRSKAAPLNVTLIQAAWTIEFKEYSEDEALELWLAYMANNPIQSVTITMWVAVGKDIRLARYLRGITTPFESLKLERGLHPTEKVPPGFHDYETFETETPWLDPQDQEDEWDFGFCEGQYEVSVSALLDMLPSFEALHLQNLKPNIDHEPLEKPAGLRKIILNNCSGITILPLFKWCPKLEELSIRGTTHLDIDFEDDLSSRGWEEKRINLSLTTLDVEQSEILYQSIYEPFVRIPHLTTFICSFVDSWYEPTKDAKKIFLEFVGRNKSITYLGVSKGVALSSVAKLAPQLRRVRLEDGGKISVNLICGISKSKKTDFEHKVMAFPHLEHLELPPPGNEFSLPLFDLLVENAYLKARRSASMDQPEVPALKTLSIHSPMRLGRDRHAWYNSKHFESANRQREQGSWRLALSWPMILDGGSGARSPE